MNIILGLNCNHADSSACIIKDGKLLFAIEEERINRIKHWAGLPCGSIDACLKYASIDLSDVTDIAIIELSSVILKLLIESYNNIIVHTYWHIKITNPTIKDFNENVNDFKE